VRLVDGAAGGVGTEVGHLQDEGTVEGVGDRNGLAIRRIDPLTRHIGLPHQKRGVLQIWSGASSGLGMCGHEEAP
jgi:hypothetical protein